MSDRWRTHFKRTLLGRIRLEIYKEVTGSEVSFPTDQAVRRFLLRRYRENPFAADFERDLLHIRSVSRVRFAKLTKPDLGTLVNNLELRPLDSPQFVEITGCPEPLSGVTGALVRRDRMKIGGYVYTILLLDDVHYPDVAFFEVRAFAQKPNPLILTQTASGTVCLDDTYEKSPQAELVFRVLHYLETHRKFEFMRAEAVGRGRVLKEEFRGPNDPEFDLRIREVALGRLSCAEFTVPIRIVRPFSTQFCLSVPKREIQEFAPHVKQRCPRLLVYWDGTALITSDDYLPYLAYRFLQVEEIPVTVMGDYPPDFGPAEDSGGWELVPEVVIGRNGRVLDDPSDAELLLEAELKRPASSSVPGELYALFMILSALIQDPSTTERDIHEFLYQNPTALDVYGGEVLSEVSLGGQYRIDLVLQYRTAERKIALVELESPRKPLFTKSGRLRAEITHAIQQVEDWLRWWKEHPAEVPGSLDSAVTPSGMVIVGRKSGLSEDEIRRIVHLNETRDVKLLTYDDLLDRLEAMIASVESVYE
jgi:hypothetical protein